MVWRLISPGRSNNSSSVLRMIGSTEIVNVELRSGNRFQWYPGNHMYLRNTDIAAGDTVWLAVGMNSTDMSTYHFRVGNYRTGSESRLETNNTHVMLCGFTTEFIVEDFWNTDRLPLVDFGNIKFQSAISEVDGGIMGGMEGIKRLEVEEEGTERKPIHCTSDGISLGCDYQPSN